jgi:hypothetical protein
VAEARQLPAGDAGQRQRNDWYSLPVIPDGMMSDVRQKSLLGCKGGKCEDVI